MLEKSIGMVGRAVTRRYDVEMESKELHLSVVEEEAFNKTNVGQG